MPASSAPLVSTATDLVVECIWLDIPVSFCPGSLRETRVLLNSSLANSRSGPPHGKDKVGGTVPRPHRSLDSCRQPRISPVAREKQISKGGRCARAQGILLRRGLECGAALAHDLPGRQVAPHPGGLADIPPDRLRE